jgi:ElaB/YqjD/DUF883 family membrane-anchored ribosome-binding protein
MDKGADRIAQDIKDIVQTREAIAEKLGAIEQHVGSTMEHARTMMTQVADKTTSSVHEALKATKESCDPRVHIGRHPWVFLGGTLLLGYSVGVLYRRGCRINGVIPYYPGGAKGAAVMPVSGSPSSERQESGVYPFYPPREGNNGSGEQDRSDQATLWTDLEQAVQDELTVVRSGFIRFGRGLLHEMARQALPALAQIIAGRRRERAPRPDHDPTHR